MSPDNSSFERNACHEQSMPHLGFERVSQKRLIGKFGLTALPQDRPAVPKPHMLRAQSGHARRFCLKGLRSVGRGPRCRPTLNAGWSSPVARQAHNLKVVSSNLAPATKIKPAFSMRGRVFSALLVASTCHRYPARRDQCLNGPMDGLKAGVSGPVSQTHSALFNRMA
jgi:hypothetical protein